MIPEAFLARMKRMPELDFEAFSAALERPAVRALRVNTLKTDADTVQALLPFDAEPLPFAENGFYAECVGGTKDLNAGQVIDRIGVALGLSFPCGPALEALALTYKGRVPKFGDVFKMLGNRP